MLLGRCGMRKGTARRARIVDPLRDRLINSTAINFLVCRVGDLRDSLGLLRHFALLVQAFLRSCVYQLTDAVLPCGAS